MSLPYMPFFVDAYLCDAGHLSDEEHGRYMLLLMAMWASPQCRIPNDDQWLARRFRRSVEDVQNQLRPIINEFCASDGNWITQGRLKAEWDWAQAKSKSNTASAKSRWKKQKDQCERSTNTECERNAPKPKPKPKEEDAPSAPAPITNQEADLYRRGKEVLGEGAGGLIKKLLAAKGTVAAARAAIEQASEKGVPREYIAAIIRGNKSAVETDKGTYTVDQFGVRWYAPKNSII